MHIFKFLLTALVPLICVLEVKASGVEYEYPPIQMKAGDQLFISGFPVSCVAPPPTVGEFTLQCTDYSGEKVKRTENTFLMPTTSTRKERLKQADQIMIEKGIDPNARCEIYGPSTPGAK